MTRNKQVLLLLKSTAGVLCLCTCGASGGTYYLTRQAHSETRANTGALRFGFKLSMQVMAHRVTWVRLFFSRCTVAERYITLRSAAWKDSRVLVALLHHARYAS